MKECSRKVIEKINSSRSKIYYKLKDLELKTGLCSRSLKYRMAKVKIKYDGIPSLLFRKGRVWQIHYTLITEFMPKYAKSETNVYNHNWTTFFTWNMKNNYEVKYHIELINQIKEKLPSTNIAYVIERDGRGYTHLHAIADNHSDEIEVAVNSILYTYLEKTDFKCQIEKINNKSSVTAYLEKSGEITIL